MSTSATFQVENTETDFDAMLPHGGSLVSRFAEGGHRQELIERAAHLQKLVLDGIGCSDLLLLANGGFSPLTGFMDEEDYGSVVRDMRLRNGLPWTLPVVLPVDRATALLVAREKELALVDSTGRLLAVLEVSTVFSRDLKRELHEVYGTHDVAHPGVAQLHRQGDWLVSGPVWVVSEPDRFFPEYDLDPRALRSRIRELSWRSVVGFQTRNPLHRAHEYLVKCALEVYDGLLLHPLVGPTRSEDIPGPVRVACYRALLDGYFPSQRVLFSTFAAAMRYAGPREAVFHALVRKNYGCTHFIVGRDHAGVGGYYGPNASQKIFENFEPQELGIVPVFFDPVFYCRQCSSMASEKTCPHGEEARLAYSGTELRRALTSGDGVPSEFTRPEVADILERYYREMRIAS